MYEYINRLKTYFKDRYNKEIIVTTPNADFETAILRTVKKSKTEARNGQSIGIPTPSDEGICHLRRTLKLSPFDSWISKNKIKEYKTYIGFTNEEKNRVGKDENAIYPLIEYFNMSEYDCKAYLINQDMENLLYRHFTRTGCGLCPFKSERDWFNTYKYYPEMFKLGKEIEEKLSNQKEYKFFHKMKPLSYHEKKFKRHDAVLFDFDDEPARDCFCKI